MQNTEISPSFLVWKFCGNSSETLRKLCLSKKFLHQEISGNSSILNRVYQRFSGILEKLKSMENYSNYDVKYARKVNNFHKDDEVRIEFTELGTVGRKALTLVRCFKGYTSNKFLKTLMNFCCICL